MRRRIDWFQILISINDPEQLEYFYSLCKKLRHGKSMSNNRCAYYVLKKYYSTTTIDELAAKLGV